MNKLTLTQLFSLRDRLKLRVERHMFVGHSTTASALILILLNHEIKNQKAEQLYQELFQ